MNEDEIKAWNEWAQSLKRRVRWDIEKIEGALASAQSFLPALEGQERAGLLQIGRVVAERSSKLAVTFLRIAPQALSLIDPSCRSTFLRWSEIFASQSRETLIEFLEKSADILEAVPENERLLFLKLGLRLAAEDWSVSFKYYLGLPRIKNEVADEKLSSWFEGGFSLISQSLPEALAYYGLESKRSRERMQDPGSAVSLAEVTRPLKLYAQALTGRNLAVRPLPDWKRGIPHPLGPLPCTDGEAIFLPPVFRNFSSAALNFSAFKLATAHQAGYMEFGTFTFKLSSVHDLFPPELWRAGLRGISDKGNPVAPLEAYFHLFPQKKLAQDLFHLLEGARVHHSLRREYRGLRKEMDRFLQVTRERRPSIQSLPLKEAVLEAILRMIVFGETPAGLPWPVFPHAEELTALITPLIKEGAVVEDSARAAVVLYRWLSALPNRRIVPIQPGTHGEDFPPLVPSIFESTSMDFAPRLAPGEEPYNSPVPLPHWGELRPELVRKKLRLREIKDLLNRREMGFPLSAEALKELLEKGLEVEVQALQDDEDIGFQGLFLTDLKDFKNLISQSQKAAAKGRPELQSEMRSLVSQLEGETGEGSYYYDEWDYRIGDYRVKWCRLKEKGMEQGSSDFVARTLENYADLIAEVRRQFQMLKPERFKKIPHLERGEEIDLNAAIEALIDRRAGHSPSEKIYIEKNRKERDFSTLFLLDMSASTDERLKDKNREANSPPSPSEEKKVIDIQKEALIIMAEALKEIGDEYSIFGFSGYGRKEVEFYTIKDFLEGYGEEVKGRIEGIKPQRSTRMGPAIRHAVEKISGRESKIKNLILISDGYPQDYDYGEDRGEKEYALKDTMMALEEAARKNIHTFCITVDRAGHDYLRQMCQPSRYLVIEETAALPRELPKIYRRLTT